jgi:ATP-grasp domain/L-amino acid ligase C-terminal domain 2
MRLLLIMPNRAYRADDFFAAAERAGAEVVVASDRCHVLDEKFVWPERSIVVDYHAPEEAAAKIVAEAGPIDGIAGTEGETPALVAALVADKLGLLANPPGAAALARDKRRMREVCARAGVPVPRFAMARVSDATPPPGLAFPVVLKPTFLGASRGVMRADDEAGYGVAHRRLARLLADPEIRARAPDLADDILVEAFVPGVEVALEGLMTAGRLTRLAFFDKPDPLDGPFFEETMYVTPSRHAESLQAAAWDVAEAAARAMGLVHGPIHAELRLSPSGPVLLEVAARSIGGLCGRMLRFGTGMGLEDVIVRHALGLHVAGSGETEREKSAAGAMMLPIPAAGVLRGVEGVDEARKFADDVVITARVESELVPLPEGDAYLGFLFARAGDPATVERRLRQAQAALRFVITPVLAAL